MNKILEFRDKRTIKEQAAAWLIRLDGDDALTVDERRELEEWLSRSPDHRNQLYRLAELWDNMNVLTALSVLLENAKQGCRHHSSDRSRRFSMTPRLLSVAAALVIGIAIGAFYFFNDRQWDDSNGLYATAIGQQRPVPLPDGSVILLNTDSQLRVNYGGQYRDIVLLRGEAHFTVARNASRTFRVSAGNGRIRAVGTAFSVYFQEDSVEVAVNEGSVVLEAVRSQAPVPAGGSTRPELPVSQPSVRKLGMLRAGEVASIVSRLNEQFERIEVLDNVASIDNALLSQRLSWTEGVLSFSGEPLGEVVREIGRYTTVKIEFSDAALRAIPVGGRFPVGETETMLETLENSFGLRVDYLSDGHVLISADDE
jgi:transmembrane sensor